MKEHSVKLGMRVQIKSRVPNFADECGVVAEMDCWFLSGECYKIVFDDGDENWFLASEFKQVKGLLGV